MVAILDAQIKELMQGVNNLSHALEIHRSGLQLKGCIQKAEAENYALRGHLNYTLTALQGILDAWEMNGAIGQEEVDYVRRCVTEVEAENL